MGIFGLINAAANRLGLIKVVEVKNPEIPQKISTRSITLASLSMEVRSEQVRALAELPAELSIEFERVYEAAGVKAPAHGWTIARLHQLLQTEQYKTMPRDAAQKAILGVLSADKVPVDDLMQDALRRDKAIDAFEGFVFKKMSQRIQARESREAQIEEQIRSLREEQDRLHEENKIDQQHWDQWHQRKTAAEEEMATAIGYLLEKPVVTIDKAPHPLRG